MFARKGEVRLVQDGGVPPYRYGDRVRDRDGSSSEPLIVISRPGIPADEWDIPTGETVAEDNPEYPESEPVVAAMYQEELESYLSEWRERGGPLRLSRVAENGGTYYSFPEARLELIEPAESTLNTDGVAGPEASSHTPSDDQQDE